MAHMASHTVGSQPQRSRESKERRQRSAAEGTLQ